ncbi:MAG: MaoC family dehydratase N-terminal domain-containing protein [Actinomycetes bacterium]|jgi:acyl dehydratase
MGDQGDSDILNGLIGRVTSRARVTVERSAVTFFADAVCDPDPIYRDANAARERGFSAIPAPPTFAFVMHHLGSFAELQPEGNPEGGLMASLSAVTSQGGLILHGEQSFSYSRSVLVGDELDGVSTIVDAYAKESKGKVMTFIVSETVWNEASSGDHVVSTRFNLIHRR